MKHRIKTSAWVAAERGLASEIRETLGRVWGGNGRGPEGMRYFCERFHRWEDPLGAAGDRPVVGVSCLQVPLELILACGASPLRFCNGSHALEQFGSASLPARTCSLVRASMGMIASCGQGLRDRMVLLVVPTTCDAKRKVVEVLAEKELPVHALEVPPSRDSEEAEFYWRNAVKKLTLALEQATGTRITRRRLAGSVRLVRRASEQFRRLSRLQRHDQPLLTGAEMFVVMSTFGFDDTAQWTAAASRLADELEKRIERSLFDGRNTPRILLSGSPALGPGFKLPLLVEEAGAAVVADELCSCTRILYDTVVDGEGGLYDRIPAVADRYLKPCTCPVFDSGADGRRRLVESVRRSNADGVVYQTFSGCQLYQMEQRMTAAVLRRADIPVLVVETDYSPEDRGQLSTRIEAFVESLQSRKER